MKNIKSIFSITFFTIVTIVNAQTIPNYSFENWTNMGSYENPDGWGTMNNTTATSSVYTATKATPGTVGNYYLKLTSKTVGASVVNGIAVSGVLDSTTMQAKSGFPFSTRPASFTGKYQYMVYGGSYGSMSVKLTRWDAGLNQRITVATINKTLTGMAMSWTSFTLNFTYVDGDYPDTCVIVLKASGSSPTNQDYLWVDNLAFSGSVVGVQDNNSVLNNVTVFPNPSNNSISIDLNLKSAQQITIELADLTGKIVFSKNLGTLQGSSKQMLDVSTITKGIYLLNVLTEKGKESKKIVIE